MGSPPARAQPEVLGKFQGTSIGTWTLDPGVGIKLTKQLVATRTVGAYTTEAEAQAAGKALGKAAAISLEGGIFVCYELTLDSAIGLHHRRTTSVGRTEFEHTPPRCVHGIVAVITSEGLVMRPGPPAPEGKDAALESRVKEQGEGDPFQPFKDVFGDGKSVERLEDKQLLKVFEAAMRDNAFAILTRSEERIKAKQAQFSGGPSKLDDAELRIIRSTAADLVSVNKEISELTYAHLKLTAEYHAEQIIDTLNPIRALKRLDLGGRDSKLVAHFQKMRELSDAREALDQKKRLFAARYPLLSRLDNRALKRLADASKQEIIGALAEDLPTILEHVAETRENILRGKLNLWHVDMLVESTLEGLGITDEAKRKAIADKVASEKPSVIEAIVMTIFQIGLGIGGTILGGPIGGAMAITGFGLGLRDAAAATEEFSVNKAASDIVEDKEGGFVAEPSIGWVIVAWIGVGLDAYDIAKVFGLVGKAAKPTKGMREAAKALADRDRISQAAEELAKQNYKKLKMTKQALKARLLAAVGEVVPEKLIGHVDDFAGLSGRVGTDITPVTGSNEVRVLWEKTASGRIRVTGIRAGTEATVADVLRHEEIVRHMRRYEELTGRLRELWDRMRALAGKDVDVNPFLERTLEWESWYKLKNMPGLIDARTERLGGELSEKQIAIIKEDLALFEQELKTHSQVVDALVMTRGRGFVANAGESTKSPTATLEAPTHTPTTTPEAPNTLTPEAPTPTAITKQSMTEAETNLAKVLTPVPVDLAKVLTPADMTKLAEFGTPDLQESLDAIRGQLSKTGGLTQAGRTREYVTTRQAAGELHVLLDMLRDPDIVAIKVVPSAAGGRSPDFYVRNQAGIEFRVEVVNITLAPKGVRPKLGTDAQGRPTRRMPQGVAGAGPNMPIQDLDYSRVPKAVRGKIGKSSKGPSQLDATNPNTLIQGRQMARGGIVWLKVSHHAIERVILDRMIEEITMDLLASSAHTVRFSAIDAANPRGGLVIFEYTRQGQKYVPSTRKPYR